MQYRNNKNPESYNILNGKPCDFTSDMFFHYFYNGHVLTWFYFVYSSWV